ncbi:hypothetical protein GAPWKB30_1755 [Gilliamella apicola]|nr:hypothetical protein GAPWKB30_1755 [Gilliamella apicola]
MLIARKKHYFLIVVMGYVAIMTIKQNYVPFMKQGQISAV